jgi:hypothetical protein
MESSLNSISFKIHYSMKYFYASLLLIVSSTSFGQDEDQVVPDFLLARVLNIRFGNSTATGFLHNDSSYFLFNYSKAFVSGN